jgi:hypothetical protein
MNRVGSSCIMNDGASDLRRWRELRCNDAKLKITPTNQSLILARDPARSGAGPSSLLRQASQWAAGGAALKRVTILAARPDATVVVQADYFSDDEASSVVDAQRPAVEQVSHNAMTVVGRNPTTLSGPAATSPYRNPIQLYTSVQRGLEDTKSALLDVLA